MINDIIIMEGDIIQHDPMYPDLKNKRHSMSFIKPRLTQFFEYDYILNDYVLITEDTTNPYYRPSEFYDHYYSPEEINKLTDREVMKYIDYYNYKSCHFEAGIYSMFLQMKNRNIMRCIQSMITEKGYRLISEIQEDYNKSHTIFDETWNTIFYYQLLLPRRNKYFVNIKQLTCSCKQKNCYHVNLLLIRMITFKFLKGSVDLYHTIKNLFIEQSTSCNFCTPC